MVKSIKISEDAWKKLMRWRIELGCKNIEDLVDRILKITTKIEVAKK